MPSPPYSQFKNRLKKEGGGKEKLSLLLRTLEADGIKQYPLCPELLFRECERERERERGGQLSVGQTPREGKKWQRK